MTVDISGLDLQPVQPLDWENYKDAQEMPPPPAKGEYIVRAPDKFEFGATKEGQLSVLLEPTIVGPSNEGFTIRFTRLSAKPFKRGKATVSQIGDYLRAVGSTARPSTPQEIADAVAATAGSTFKIIGDWEAYDKDTGQSVKGMESFPPNDSGGYVPFVKVESGTGEPKSLRANFRITRFVAAGQ